MGDNLQPAPSSFFSYWRQKESVTRASLLASFIFFGYFCAAAGWITSWFMLSNQYGPESGKSGSFFKMWGSPFSVTGSSNHTSSGSAKLNYVSIDDSKIGKGGVVWEAKDSSVRDVGYWKSFWNGNSISWDGKATLVTLKSNRGGSMLYCDYDGDGRFEVSEVAGARLPLDTKDR